MLQLTTKLSFHSNPSHQWPNTSILEGDSNQFEIIPSYQTTQFNASLVVGNGRGIDSRQSTSGIDPPSTSSSEWRLTETQANVLKHTHNWGHITQVQ